jgi:hypothetical protein
MIRLASIFVVGGCAHAQPKPDVITEVSKALECPQDQVTATQVGTVGQMVAHGCGKYVTYNLVTRETGGHWLGYLQPARTTDAGNTEGAAP